jgi:hypothetical protein
MPERVYDLDVICKVLFSRILSLCFVHAKSLLHCSATLIISIEKLNSLEVVYLIRFLKLDW